MTEIGQIGLASLSTGDLRRLLVRLRETGRTEAAQLVLRELERRHALHAGEAPASPERLPRHWRVIAAGAGAAVLAISAAVLGPLLLRPDARPAPEPPAGGRAMVALTPPAAPIAAPPDARRIQGPARDDPPAAQSSSSRSRPAADRDLPPDRLPYRDNAGPRLATADRLPEPTDAPQADVGDATFAVSRAPALLAASCGSSQGAARMICDDARRSALGERQARGGPVPVRVAITPGGARALAAPAGAPR